MFSELNLERCSTLSLQFEHELTTNEQAFVREYLRLMVDGGDAVHCLELEKKYHLDPERSRELVQQYVLPNMEIFKALQNL